MKSVEKKKKATERHDHVEKTSFIELQNGWKKKLSEAIEKEIELVKANNKGLSPYICEEYWASMILSADKNAVRWAH